VDDTVVLRETDAGHLAVYGRHVATRFQVLQHVFEGGQRRIVLPQFPVQGTEHVGTAHVLGFALKTRLQRKRQFVQQRQLLLRTFRRSNGLEQGRQAKVFVGAPAAVQQQGQDWQQQGKGKGQQAGRSSTLACRCGRRFQRLHVAQEGPLQFSAHARFVLGRDETGIAFGIDLAQALLVDLTVLQATLFNAIYALAHPLAQQRYHDKRHGEQTEQATGQPQGKVVHEDFPESRSKASSLRCSSLLSAASLPPSPASSLLL